MNIEEKRNLVRNAIAATHGRFYTVVFNKKTDGKQRVMNCRQAVSKYAHGGHNNAADKADLVSTYDMKNKAYRTIYVDGVREIRYAGRVIKFED